MAQRRRWPDKAEDHRRSTIMMIREARRLIQEIRKEAKKDPDLVIMMAADAETSLADAERYLVLARSGETEEDQ